MKRTILLTMLALLGAGSSTQAIAQRERGQSRGMAVAPDVVLGPAVEMGLLTARADEGGWWARFAHPVREGQMVRIRDARDGDEAGTARIQWASPVAPYEAYLTDVRVFASLGNVPVRTPYQALFNDREAGGYDRSGITPGFVVVAQRGPAGNTTDVLSATIQMLASRPETREFVQQLTAGSSHDIAQLERVSSLLSRYRLRHWNDPVAARLAGRLADLVSERYGTVIRPPADWQTPTSPKTTPGQEVRPNP